MSAALHRVEPFAAPVRVMLVGVAEGPASPAFVLDTSAEAARLADDLIGRADREHLLAFLLDGRHSLIGVHTVSIGSHNTAPGNPAGLLRAALLASAAGFILAHNHPSGDLQFSELDLGMWHDLRYVARLLEIKALDFIVIVPSGSYRSVHDWTAKREAKTSGPLARVVVDGQRRRLDTRRKG